jgi:predicted nucleic acid-binding protein
VRRVFADTFYWIALLSTRDQWSRVVREFSATLGGAAIVTTEEVLVELASHFSGASSHAREATSAMIRSVPADPNVMVVPQSHESFLAGLALYEARPDKGYSLVDCVSMATMLSLAIEEALTADRHFGQEGFAVLFQ